MGCGSSAVDTYDSYQESIRAGILPSEKALDAQNVLDRFYFEPGLAGVPPVDDSTGEKSGSGRLVATDGSKQEPSLEVGVVPTFHGAACRNPMTKEVEHFLLVGLQTRYDGQAGFRGPMRLLFVLDTSGSMGQYYDIRSDTRTRLEVAKGVLLDICKKHLRAGDEVAIIATGEQATVLRPLQPWKFASAGVASEEDLQSVEACLRPLHAVGGSNLKLGVTTAYLHAQEARSLSPASSSAASPLATRLFVLTDFAANLGQDDRQVLLPMASEHPMRPEPLEDSIEMEPSWGSHPHHRHCTPEEKPRAKRYGVLDAVEAMAEPAKAARIPRQEDTKAPVAGFDSPPVYTTFLFVGLQLASSAAEQQLRRLAAISGCNALTMTTGQEARDRFDQSFESMVTPVARELRLELHGSPFVTEDVVRCGGSTATGGSGKLLRGDGEFYRARSVFPSPAVAGRSRGGVVLFRLRPLDVKPGQTGWQGVRTTVALSVENAAGERLSRHFTLELPCVPRRPREEPNKLMGAKHDDWPPDFVDVFQTKSVEKAVALWHYARFSKELLETHRASAGLKARVITFKQYFEAAAARVGDNEMLKEVSLWDQLVEIKEENLRRNKTCSCHIL